MCDYFVLISRVWLFRNNLTCVDHIMKRIGVYYSNFLWGNKTNICIINRTMDGFLLTCEDILVNTQNKFHISKYIHVLFFLCMYW